MWLIDSAGLVASQRDDLSPEKATFAQDASRLGLSSLKAPLAEVVAAVRPTALIGAAAVGGAFDERVIRALLKVRLGFQITYRDCASCYIQLLQPSINNAACVRYCCSAF